MAVRNKFTGEVGQVVGAWKNCADQVVLNVRVNGMAASWLATRVSVMKTEKAA